jgi:hypothetical protein
LSGCGKKLFLFILSWMNFWFLCIVFFDDLFMKNSNSQNYKFIL